MQQNTNISIIQLVKSGELNIVLEISRIRAKQDINIAVTSYLKKSIDYQTIAEKLRIAEENFINATSDEKLFYSDSLENLRKVEQDFIVNALLLAKTFANIEIHTKRLKEASRLFEEGKISEADKILHEADLLNDQFNLIAFAKFLEERKQYLSNVIKNNKLFPEA